MNQIYSLEKIETPRLIIRPVQLGDAIPLNKSINNSLNLLQKWQGWAQDPSLAATEEFIQKGVFAWESASISDFPMVVIHKEKNKIIGASGYNDRSNPQQGLYEVGYWCDVSYQGQGLVTEYVNALTRYAFTVLAAKEVIILSQIENTKSIAVAKRLHFHNTGIQGRNPADCLSTLQAKDYRYAITNIEKLPPLKATWEHDKKLSTDSKIIAWAKEELKITDMRAFANSKTIIKTPWSNVITINTGDKYVYLKHMPKLIALEPIIIGILQQEFNAPVPNLISHNLKLDCFLMEDSGSSLRSILKQNFDVNLLCKAVTKFTSMQLATAKNIDIFLNLGIPDYRLDKLPRLYMDVISQQDWLAAEGLSAKEITKLASFYPKVTMLCQKLKSSPIKPTIIQPDFSDNNMVVDQISQKITLIDLGEISISHPFFSLLNCLRQVQKHYNLTEKDQEYIKIKNACFCNYMPFFSSPKDITNEFALIQLITNIYELVVQYQFMHICGRDNLIEVQHWKLQNTLQEILAIYE